MVRYVKKKKGPLGQDNGVESSDNNSGHRLGSVTKETNLPIQDLQNLIDISTQRLTVEKHNYLLQNSQFAKDNSLLKVKVSELENKLNDLIKENLNLRTMMTKNRINYEKVLNEQINTLENGIFQRFEEIMLMFDNVRKKENFLNCTNSKLMQFKNFLKDNSNNNKKETASSHNNNNNNNILKESDTQLERKRKKRRQSMFVPSDFDFSTSNSEIGIESGKNSINNDDDNINKTIDTKNEIMTYSTSTTIATTPPQTSSPTKNISNDSNEDFTNSLIDYSIPEDKPILIPNINNSNNTIISINNNNSNSSDSSSTNKLKIFSDVECNNKNNNKISTDKKNTSLRKTPPRIKIKRKNIIKDDVMPKGTTDIVLPKKNNTVSLKKINNKINTETIPTTRSRRTRGKAVNYKLPSLRAKMRRPTEKLVDATTTTDINDLQVTKIVVKQNHDNNSENIPHSMDNSMNSTEPEIKVESISENISDIIKESGKEKEREHTEIKTKDPDIDTLNKTPKLNRKKRSKPVYEKHENPLLSSPLSISTSSPSIVTNKNSNKNPTSKKESNILSDVTRSRINKLKRKNNSKKKLLKTAIINDLYDDADDLEGYDSINGNFSRSSISSSSSRSFSSSPFASYSNNSNTFNNSSNLNKSVSFRFNDDDLSVFDLIGQQKNKMNQNDNKENVV